MSPKRAGVALIGFVVAAFVVALLCTGCGSVGDVGYGASRGGVDPVRGTYGYGDSEYSPAVAQKQADQVERLAKANLRSDKKGAAIANKVKALADEDSATAPDVEGVEQPTLEPSVKALVAQEATPGSAAEAAAGEESPLE